jgi:OmpA-OmpF porin, OOP family
MSSHPAQRTARRLPHTFMRLFSFSRHTSLAKISAMKKFMYFLLMFSFLFIAQSQAQLVDKFKSKVKQRVDDKVDAAMDKTLDDAENTVKETKAGKKNKSDNKDKAEDKKKETQSSTQTEQASVSQPVLKVYQNYDFVPGDKILFEDNFVDDQDGEFPSHWELTNGQATLNRKDGVPAIILTEGNAAVVKPRMKTEKYLTDPFTIEFDYYHLPGASRVLAELQYVDKTCNCEGTANVAVNENEVKFEGLVTLLKEYSPGQQGDNFSNKWHHIAMAYKNRQLKIYVDQDRILVVPDTKTDFYNVFFAGLGDEQTPVIFKNVRIASGGNMNMIGKKFTDAKIVTHGINFDVDKAVIKPESMGTLNMIVQVMKDNPTLKFEIDGHTDNTGTSQHNVTLSQQRAEAIRTQLISMGIDASRLTTKGFGDTMPVSDNSTLDGKANNRRVEFVKI